MIGQERNVSHHLLLWTYPGARTDWMISWRRSLGVLIVLIQENIKP